MDGEVPGSELSESELSIVSYTEHFIICGANKLPIL